MSATGGNKMCRFACLTQYNLRQRFQMCAYNVLRGTPDLVHCALKHGCWFTATKYLYYWQLARWAYNPELAPAVYYDGCRIHELAG